MTRSTWSVAQMAAYLQALVDAGMGLSTIYIQHIDDDDVSVNDGGVLLDTKFRRNDDDNPDDPGLLTLSYGHL